MLLIQLERHFMGHFTIWLKCRVSLREIITVTQTPSLPAVVVALWTHVPICCLYLSYTPPSTLNQSCVLLAAELGVHGSMGSRAS